MSLYRSQDWYNVSSPSCLKLRISSSCLAVLDGGQHLWIKAFLRRSQESTVPGGSLSTHLLVAPVKVIGKTCSMTALCDTPGMMNKLTMSKTRSTRSCASLFLFSEKGRIEALGSDGNLRSCLSGQGGLGGYSETRRGSRVEDFRRIRVGSWNVGSLTCKLLELVDALERHRVDITCFQETKWKGSSNKEVNGYNLWHIGATTEGYSGVHRGFGYEVRNEEGRSILDFATAHDLVVVNSYFKKRDHHLITFQSGGRCTQIDYLLVRRGDLKACKDYKVFPGEACSSQHRFLAMDTLFKRVQRRRVGSAAPRILWKNLNGDAAEAFRSRVLEGASTQIEAISASDVQFKVADKQARFRELLSCREAQAKEKAYEELYKKLDSKEGENVIFKIAKAQQRRIRDLGDIRFIKDEGDRTITDEEEIKKRRGEYFSSLFNTREPEGREEVERVVERRLRRETSVSENQFGFMPGRSSIDEIHLIRSLMEKYRERQRDLHLAFIDLEKAYDNVPRELIWKTQIAKGASRRMEVAELRMLMWTCGKTMLDMIPNGVYRAELEVETIINKMREGRLRWFGHVRRRPQSTPVRRVEALVVDDLRRRAKVMAGVSDVDVLLGGILSTKDNTGYDKDGDNDANGGNDDEREISWKQ
ncbi:retrovirus-related pol polyprotein LINE-1 [Tanacetum coccineum]